MAFVNKNNYNLNNNHNNKDNKNIKELKNNQNNKDNQNIIELKNKIIELEKDKKKLENIINELKKDNMRIKEYENEIIKLKNELNEYENENQNLKNQIKNLTNKLNAVGNKNISNNNKDKIIELMEELKMKENEIKDIKSILSFDIKKGDKLMTIIFYSVDQKYHYSLICKNTDKFSTIEQKLFEIFPECQEYNYFFMVNGIRITNRYKTLEELKIKNSDIITMNISEFE